jgi:hypothetical protein
VIELRVPGVGRDKDNAAALCFYFNRRATDDEMRFLHDVLRRAVAMHGLNHPELTVPDDEAKRP